MKCKNCGHDIIPDNEYPSSQNYTNELTTVYIHTDGIYSCKSSFMPFNRLFATAEDQYNYFIPAEKD